MKKSAGSIGFSRLAGMYLVLIAVFAVFGIACLAVSRLEHLQPAVTVFQPHFFGQLLGLHKLLLHFFVLLPVIPLVIGYAALGRSGGEKVEPAFPRLALSAWFLFLAGGALMLWTFMWGKIETGWAYAVAYTTTRDLVSGSMLMGIMLGSLSLQLNAVNIIATIRKQGLSNVSLFSQSLFWSSWVAVVALSVVTGTTLLGLAAKFAPTALFGAAQPGETTALAFLYAFAETPMRLMVILPALGIACAVFEPEARLSASSKRRIGWYMAAVALLGLLAVDARAIPQTTAPFLSMAGNLFKIMVIVPLFAIMAHLLMAAFKGGTPWKASGLYAFGAMLMILLVMPLDIFLSLPASRFYASSYLDSASYYLLVTGGCFLSVLAALFHRDMILNQSDSQRALATFLALVIMAGVVTTFTPMALMGLKGLSMDLAVYPSSLLPLQVLSTAGGTILLGGTLASILLLFFSYEKQKHSC